MSDVQRPRTLRLFVAIELPDETRRELGGATDALRQAGVDNGVRWVRPEGMHLTLKFLGAVEEERVATINTALRIGLGDAEAFDLQPEGVGTFGSGRRPRVLWVGVGGDTGALADLAARVERALVPLGFPTEQRAFSAHLTLARVRDDGAAADGGRIADAVAALQLPQFSAFHVKHLSLMQSTIAPGGATYSAVSSFPLVHEK